MKNLNISLKELEIQSADNIIRIYKNSAFHIYSIEHDSRKVTQDDWFICLVGENNNGHKYVEDVLKKNPAGIIFQKNNYFTSVEKNIPFIEVKNTNLFLAQLAIIHRNQINPYVIAITGSNGKTSTKQIVSFLWEQFFEIFKQEKNQVCFTRGNLNNHFGLPFTMLSLRENHKVLVVEMGTNHPGEIKQLTSWAKPDLTVIVSISTGHIGNFSSTENIAYEKSDIILGMNNKNEKILVIPKNIAYREFIEKKCKEHQTDVFFPNNQFILEIKKNYKILQDKTIFSINNKEYIFPLVGEHQFSNFLLAVQVLLLSINSMAKKNQWDINSSEIEKILLNVFNHLNQIDNVKGRLSLVKNQSLGFYINLWDDTYNANLASFKEAISFLGKSFIEKKNSFVEESTSAKSKLIGVFGEMAELGELAKEHHFELARFAVEQNFKKIFFSSNNKGLQKVFQNGWQKQIDTQKGKKDFTLEIFDNSEKSMNDIYNKLKIICTENDVILFKGSRSTAMERVLKKFFTKDLSY